MIEPEWEAAVRTLMDAGASNVSRLDRPALGRPRDGLSIEFKGQGETKRVGWSWDAGVQSQYGLESAVSRALSRLELWKTEANAHPL